ncbi:capsular polysaccharide transport system ATP-binding protein [Roseovarius azorensis]|uniref:Capsular polysaccharide transport system ATP-binding protein n=1 Tax=Roseovarius azorensis TaxID=1287727 RepID=A0A1H7PZE6_9RHOB|nr:ABC transporter ATP-binding protein [Roseovarius azorensis]SEL40417.1 capsular polysaccharide transport system ATP-binding protein [Roseovarius azorensis]
MIRLERLSKSFAMRGERKTVIDNVTATFPEGRSVALLGRNGAGKSTLLQIIAGTIRPTSGCVVSEGSVSYPVGFAGSFHPDLTGLQNTRFVARLYGVDTDELVDFVEDFAELGRQFRMPLRSYSSGMRSRLSFGVSMGIPFDTYLVDEVTSVGDGAFRRKSIRVFDERRKTSGAIVVTHSMPMVRRMCDMAAVLEEGRLVFYNDLEAAIAHHEHEMALPVQSGRANGW